VVSGAAQRGIMTRTVIPANAGIHFDLAAIAIRKKGRMDPSVRWDDGLASQLSATGCDMTLQ
jgi:hypothetical protein